MSDILYSPHQPSIAMKQKSYSEFIKNSNMFFEGIYFFSFLMNDSNKNEVLIVPDGCVDIFICCDKKKTSANVCGSLLKGKKGNFLKAECEYFCIRFLPGYAVQYLGHPAYEFTEKEIPLMEAMRNAELLLDNISFGSSFEDKIRIFQQAFTDIFPKAGKVPYQVKYFVDSIIENQGCVNMHDLAEKTGYSLRYINKLFDQYVGMSPKLFSRIVRFQKALTILLTKESFKSIEMALELGYYDQNHFIKEFKEFCCITPKKFMKNILNSNID